MRINFRLIRESLRISENQSLDLFENQFQTYLRIIENQQESARINENQSLDLFKDQFQTCLRIIENQQESLRIGENHQESHKK